MGHKRKKKNNQEFKQEIRENNVIEEEKVEVSEEEIEDTSSKEENITEEEIEDTSSKEEENETIEKKEVPVEESKEVNNKKNNALILILFVLILILACMATYIITDKNNNLSVDKTEEKETKGKKETEEKEEDEDDKEVVEKEDNDKEEPVDNYKYDTKVYANNWSYSFEKTDWNEYAYSIKTETVNPKVIIKKGDLVLYNDNTLKVLDVKTKKITDLKITKKYDDYKMNLSKDRKKVVGLVGSSKNSRGEVISESYINLVTGKTLYQDNKNDLSVLNEDYLINYVENGKDENDMSIFDLHIMSTNEERVVKKLSDFGVCENIVESENDSNIFAVSQGCVGISSYRFMNSNFEYFTDELNGNEFAYTKNGNLYVLMDNTINEYDEKGKVINTIRLDGEVMHIFNDYYLTKENDRFYIKDYKNFSKVLGNVPNDKYYYHFAISGYYDKNALSSEKEKSAGYYFIIELGSESMGDGDGAGIEYYFDPITKEVDSWELEHVGGYAKPVLYLYPEKKTKVTVDFEHEDNLTTTYPKFKDSWVVTAHPNGDLYDKDGKYYYGLYWEEEKNHEVDFKEGFYVTKNNAITFLEEKLSLLGLNDKERNEFIMYWLPILEKNGKSLVYFEQTKERDKYNKLLINPKPDSVLRIAIHVKKVNKKVDIKEQKLKKFTRKGFTVVEWGGVKY